ncbi:hydroxypyruvate reductase [Aliiroseovarius halocynthiae]|uniref:DUF4147 domain-containing protein n=1 Tax=Aliiroseovarius halocynthiae TaxID=985055 RepID=A0A545SQ84_9RHOB|nr:DUF4147 domain-containing protein [Aliiroseovarius halocynthiae]TQV67128.1 DUF4147 domain-containing protein [Aliiroseovarius halocynthiae]SMR82144.1 hydroxypyruvate reductase [Aliiroseovarius halocynthiae]
MTDLCVDALRQATHQIFMKAIEAADPACAIKHTVRHAPFPTPGPGGKSIVISIGKAAPAMMQEALKHVDGAYSALCVTHPENRDTVDGARVIYGAHPVPDETSLAAGQAVADLLSQAGDADQVIALISGGGSALMALPVPGISIADKGRVSAALLGAGVEITQMNLVRQKLSQLKGGGLLHAAHPAPVSAYILSDVIGDDLRAIASGPTVGPIGTREEAFAICKKSGIWDDLPAAVQIHLSQAEPKETPLSAVQNILIGSNGHSLRAAQVAARKAGTVQVVFDMLTGDVKNAATTLLDAANSAPSGTTTVLLAGGETTVHLTGNGRGGRNQELAMHVAIGADKRGLVGDWAFLSGGTDGRDGPTDAAGGIVDATSLARMRSAGADPAALLSNNDSYAALAASDDLLMTGATGTNVADIQCLIISKP